MKLQQKTKRNNRKKVIMSASIWANGYSLRGFARLGIQVLTKPIQSTQLFLQY